VTVPSAVARSIVRLNLRNVWRWFAYGSLIGVVAGVGAIVFNLLCQAGLHYFLDVMAGFRPTEPPGEVAQWVPTDTPLRLWMLPLVPALGGLLAGLLIYWLAPEAGGHGTDAAIDAFHRKRGIMRGRIPFVKTIASALTIGSGGSGGREGPIAQIGAGFGSFLAQKLKLGERDRRILLAAGVGAGVGSIFRAPLAGALFAAEILYSEPEFESEVIIPAAISTIIAYCVFSFYFGFGSLFDTPPLVFHGAIELVPYTILALVVALAAGLFTTLFYRTHDFFEGLKIPAPLRPMIGGLAAGTVALALYMAIGEMQVLDVLGFGYGSLQNAIDGRLSILVLLALAGGKMLTTSLSIGSGGSGGVFGPSMVIGGSLGGAVGLIGNLLMPAVVTQPETYVLVGMAGFFAAAANAPISTLVMVSEMTGNYLLLLPSLWVCALAYMLGRRWSIYRHQVPTRLESPAHQGDFFVDVLENIYIRDIVKREPPQSIHEAATVREIIQRFADSPQQLFPVEDSSQRMIGVVSLIEIRQLLDEEGLQPLVIARDIAMKPKATLTLDENLNTALQHFVALEVDELPVVSKEDPDRVVAMISRQNLISAYNRRRLERMSGAKVVS
jgi:CIC family chloride channel protein